MGGDSLAETVTSFVDEGVARSVILVGSTEMSSEVRSLAAECGVAFTTPNGNVQDHFHYQQKSGDQTLLESSNYMQGNVVLSESAKKAPLLWRGVGQYVDPNNELAFSAIRGYSTSYSLPAGSSALTKDLKYSGEATSLVSLVQTRNNARVMVSGSMDMFSDAFFSGGSSNARFCEDVTSWVMGYKALLRAEGLKHRLVGATESQDVYRIKDELTVSLVVQQWDAVLQKWLPFKANDMQVELTMLDPHLRTTFQQNKVVCV